MSLSPTTRHAAMVAVLVVVALGGSSGPGLAQDEPQIGTLLPVETVASICGSREITIADMRWPSASILAHIHSIILFEQFGCAARIVGGDIASTGSSMATTQQPAIAPEMWIARIPEIWNSATSAGSVRPVANTFLGGPMEGWFVPGFVAEENRQLVKAEQLFELRDIFGGIGHSRLVSCPADWACAVINRNLMKAFRLRPIYTIEEPASRFELDQTLADAISRREPIVIYYWQPNAAISQFSLKSLDLGPFNPDAWPCLAMVECAKPAQSSFPVDPVVIAIATWLQEEAPLVVEYLQQAIMPLDEMNRLLALLSDSDREPAQIARQFYDTREDIWRRWLPAGLK